MAALNNKLIPKPSLRREMVRIVADDILESNSSPNRKLCREVASNIAAQYPDSFQDKVCGQLLSNGYESLTGQLINRCENLRRLHTKKLKNFGEIEDADSSTTAVSCKRKIVDSYGCVNWSPEFPEGETFETLIQKKNIMKQLDPNDYLLIKKQIGETYCLQRVEINGGAKIECLLEGWPQLFTEVGLHYHFQLLTAINLEEKLAKSLETRGSDYWKFFGSVQNKKMTTFIRSVDERRDEINRAISFVEAVAIYFDEEISKFILTSEVSVIY